MHSVQNLNTLIKKLAINNGFSICGVSSVKSLPQESNYLKEWLEKEYNGEMHYMINNADKRMDPRNLVDGSKSIISVLQNYSPEEKYKLKSSYKVSKYAYGKDYHYVVKDKLRKLADDIQKITGEFNFRVFTDSAPIFDKAWAQKAGLGWIGKNTCLINKEMGSFFFIGHIICNLEIPEDKEFGKNYCGNCTKCIDACPNNAITSAYEIDARKCISYLTIELKNKTEKSIRDKTHSWIFGCDICQDVCPWNKFSIHHNEPSFNPVKELLEMQDKDWENLSNDQFKDLFKDTAFERTGYDNLMKNIKAANPSD